jgi:hypothetical protein
MFQHRGAIIRGPFSAKECRPNTPVSYCVSFTEEIKILNINILRYMKLITINLGCFNINGIESIKNKPFTVLQLFTTVWILRSNIHVDRM